MSIHDAKAGAGAGDDVAIRCRGDLEAVRHGADGIVVDGAACWRLRGPQVDSVDGALARGVVRAAPPRLGRRLGEMGKVQAGATSLREIMQGKGLSSEIWMVVATLVRRLCPRAACAHKSHPYVMYRLAWS